MGGFAASCYWPSKGLSVCAVQGFCTLRSAFVRTSASKTRCIGFWSLPDQVLQATPNRALLPLHARQGERFPLQYLLQTALATALSALECTSYAGLTTQAHYTALSSRCACPRVPRAGCGTGYVTVAAVADGKHATDFPSNTIQWYALRMNITSFLYCLDQLVDVAGLTHAACLHARVPSRLSPGALR